MKSGRNSQRGKGFTLIELLVVVSILALLIAILLPSLRSAREQARSLKCAANMHSIGQAFTLYAEKYGGVWPPAIDTFGQQNRWPVPFHDGDIIHAKLARFDSSGKLITKVDESIFLCPSEKAERIIPDWTNSTFPAHPVDRVEVGGSYALNEEIHRRDGKLERGYFPPPSAVPPFVNKIDNCRRASEVYAVMENYRPIENTSTPGWRYCRGAKEVPFGSGNFTQEGTAFYIGYRTFDGKPAESVTPDYKDYRIIGGRHKNRGNALAIDTHVESYRPEKLKYNQVSWDRWKGSNDPPGGQ
jgi:prepilin-type N-terminal cleavage/methylation domain-containing protein